MQDEATRAGQGEGYAINAPYYDLIYPVAARNALGEALCNQLVGVRHIVEIGAGTGAMTEVMLNVLPAEGTILAVEPTAMMRAALTSRLSGIPRAVAAVTIVPDDALVAEVPADMDALVACNVIMHFSPAGRQALWSRWAEPLRPGGIVAVEPQFPQSPMNLPATVVPGRSLGRRTYDTVTRAEMIDDERIRWVMTYRVREGDRVMSEETTDFDCWIISDDVLDRELAEAGCVPVEGSDALRVWRRR